MVAHVLEVPVCPRVARQPPAVAVAGSWHVGEGEALGGEPHPVAARVLQRPPIGPDAVIVGHATVGAEREVAPPRRRWDVRRLRLRVADEAREQLAVERAVGQCGIQPHHGHLLGHLAAATQHRQGGPAGQPVQDVARL